MSSHPNEWTFSESERDDVSYGKMCPRCKSPNVKNVGSNFDGINANLSFNCNECGESWEGY